MIHAIATTVIPFAAETAEEESGTFLVSPGIGLMIWVLLIFGIAFLILRSAKGFGFGRITEALERRQNMIAESIDHAEPTRAEADELLADYRQRLTEARAQADEIVARARTAADQREADAQAKAAVRARGAARSRPATRSSSRPRRRCRTCVAKSRA